MKNEYEKRKDFPFLRAKTRKEIDERIARMTAKPADTKLLDEVKLDPASNKSNQKPKQKGLF